MSKLLIAMASFAWIGAPHAAPIEKPGRATCPVGFSALESSNACVRISGRVRADTVFASPQSRSAGFQRIETRGRVQLDMRKQTEYGPLRAVIRAEGLR